MSLEAVLSSSPCLDFEGRPEGNPLSQWFDDLTGTNGWRTWWIVPTSRRRRQIVRRVNSAALLPRVLTFDGLMQQLQGFARDQRRVIGNIGQLLRVAIAWKKVHPHDLPTSGRIQQLKGIISEWIECGASPPIPHPHAAFVRAYTEIVENDGCLDRTAILKVLANEIHDKNSPLAGILHAKQFLFDGFHRFSEQELNLIQAMGQVANVRLWLVTAEGQPYHNNVARILERLNVEGKSDQRKAGLLSQVGRSLFSTGTVEHAKVDLIPAPSMESECQAVAAKIKSLMRDWNNGSRLSDIAVVVPDDGYLPLLKNTFRAARIDYSPAAEMFSLAESRPARVLFLALRLFQRGWQAETLFDFLRQPLLFRRLKKNHLLEWLRQRSTLAVEKTDWKSWQEKWSELIAQHEKMALEDEEERGDEQEERSERVKHRTRELFELLDSIGKVLVPVEELERELSKKSAKDPTVLVAAISSLLESIRLSTWLSPAGLTDWTLIPPREWEIDQLAFNNLKDVLLELHETPVEDFPRDKDGRIDVELVLKLALAAENFQTSAEDDAGVQILKPRTIRGSKFRAVFAVGLVEGKVPRDVAENPVTALSDSLIARLRTEQMHEQEYLFAQLFESAQERLVLTWPTMENDSPLMESPFLRQVREKIGKTELHRVPPTIIDLRYAMLFVDQLERKNDHDAQRMIASRDIWKQRQAPEQLHIKEWARPLLALRYPKEKAFSATALEKYASCPFHHFASKTLGLDELERDDAAMRWGSFLHDVLDRFFKSSKPDDSTPPHDRFSELLRKEWPGIAATLDPYYFHDFEKALTEAFFAVSDYLAREGFDQVESEWEEKAIEIPMEDGVPLLLHVKIDRIDRHKGGDAELICDFKTGVVTSGARLRERIAAGRALQLPLYGYARQSKTGIRVTHGIYVKLSRKVESTPDKHAPFIVHVGTSLTMPSRAVKIEFKPEEARERAIMLATEMRKGQIPLSEYPSDHKDPACQSYCTARHACRHPKGYKFD